MFQRLGNFVSRYWLLTILFWIALVVAVRMNTPRWDSVTHDGDFEYMPAHMPSVQGEQLMRAAFPNGRSKSDAVIILARDDRKLDAADYNVVRSMVSRFQNLLGTSLYEQSLQLDQQLAEIDESNAESKTALEEKATELRTDAMAAFDEALKPLEDREQMSRDQYFANPAHNLALLYLQHGKEADAEYPRSLAFAVRPELKEQPARLADSHGAFPLIDVWSPYTATYGGRLVSKDEKAALIFLRLSNEFMAAENLDLMKTVDGIMHETKAALDDWPDGLTMGLSGSAAVGSDLLTSAKDSIANTELYTVILVISILLVVYRSPALIAIPLITIVASLLVGTGVVAALTTVNELSGMEWWNFKIFTTTKIFVVVILFGAGTDYCLFLIARYKEELATGKSRNVALADALGGVGEALAASAFTTIIGLGTMFFAQFGKLRNSGPTIGLCLFVTLIACISLAPALLRAIGGLVNWTLPMSGKTKAGDASDGAESAGRMDKAWHRVADVIVQRPWAVLVSCTLVMLPFFFFGLNVSITFDLLSELDPEERSKQGTAMMRQHFSIGQSGPVIVLAQKPDSDLSSADGVEAIRDLTNSLYVEGVESVRSLVSPIGTKPKSGARSIMLRNMQASRDLYLSQEPTLAGDVARLELVLAHDPFSLAATRVLENVQDKLDEISDDENSYWSGARFVYAGTTAAIRDLREVTTDDNVRIQQLVVLSVLIILLILLRRPAVCIYLIISVLFSYYVTIGATQLWFQWTYGESFQGLDWKVPLFLFVILVAIGQDYNIYLATRVFEEQKVHGMFGGLRQAIVRTGGIITSCGVIMAGTFLSMMTGSLRGIAELGFALTLGVLLDTFVVRPILVPAFLAILFRWHSHRQDPPASDLPNPPVPAPARA